MKILAAIVTCNRKELLRQALDALYASSVQPDILVFDNASTDGTRWMLDEDLHAHKIHYHKSNENLGGAGGYFHACQYALKNGYDYIWLMDDDTIVKPDSLQILLDAKNQYPDAGFYSSKALWTDGSENRMNVHRLIKSGFSSESLKPLKSLKSSQKDAPVLCREATFVSMLIPVDMIRKAGLPIKEFFIWGDDIEYSRRISAIKPGLYVPASTVVHKTLTNSGSNIAADSLDRLERYRYAYRNEVFMARKEGGIRPARQLLKILYHTARILVQSDEARLKKIGVVWSASKEGLNFNPKIVKE